ncbi:hypothetical protein FRB95_010735 [Tulasnella sp. JGI-2019a]|nr:hypothetical protein FRB95_010735 [Tulasnella sp. JGI-2019a]
MNATSPAQLTLDVDEGARQGASRGDGHPRQHFGMTPGGGAAPSGSPQIQHDTAHPLGDECTHFARNEDAAGTSAEDSRSSSYPGSRQGVYCLSASHETPPLHQINDTDKGQTEAFLYPSPSTSEHEAQGTVTNQTGSGVEQNGAVPTTHQIQPFHPDQPLVQHNVQRHDLWYARHVPQSISQPPACDARITSASGTTSRSPDTPSSCHATPTSGS